MIVREECRYSYAPDGPWSGWVRTSMYELGADDTLWEVKPARRNQGALDPMYVWYEARVVPFEMPADPRGLTGWGFQRCSLTVGESCTQQPRAAELCFKAVDAYELARRLA